MEIGLILFFSFLVVVCTYSENGSYWVPNSEISFWKTFADTDTDTNMHRQTERETAAVWKLFHGFLQNKIKKNKKQK